MADKPTTIEEYIDAFHAETRVVLNEIHSTIGGVMPEAEETISYRIPTFKIDGRYVVYFAGFAKHVSVYPVLDDMGDLEESIARYRSGRGTLKFPLNEPVPYHLIGEVAGRLLASRRRA